MRHDTAGDPITGVKWSRRTTRKIAEELAALGIAVSKNTVGRLLKDMDFKLRVNRKQIASTKNPDRNQQFLYMGQQREQFASQGLPIISVDTKKKEQIGNFKNTGAKWDREPILVKDHDFRSDADGMAIPYGIYDTQANRGAVFVGTSHDTPAFAVDAIAQWWLKEGCQRSRPPANYSSWLTAEEVTARDAAPGGSHSGHNLHSSRSHRYRRPLSTRSFQVESH